jgi:hypothetical protein
MNISMPPGDWQSMRLELVVLHLVGLALLVAVILAWGRNGRQRLVASGVLSVVAIAVIYALTVRPSDIPIDWITVLQHGLERKSIMHLYARGAHAGANFGFVLAMAVGRAPNLHDAVWLNLLLALVNAVIFFHVARHVTGRVWACVWTLVFALNPAMFLAAFSEMPSHLLTLYFLFGLIAWAALHDELPQPFAVRVAGYALCAVLTVLVAITRFEVALVGAVALAVEAGYVVLGPDSWSAAARRLRDAAERPLVFFSDHPAAVVLLCVAGWVLVKTGVPGLVGHQQLISFYPFFPAIFSLFAFLPMLALPIGVSLACLVGFVGAIGRFRRFGGLPLSLVILSNAYFAAWYEYFEMGRYLSYILAAIFLLGLFGKEQFDEMVGRRCSPNWGRAARIGYLMAWFTLPLPGVIEYYARPAYHWSGGVAQLLLERDTQREVRYLLTLTEKDPQCVFIARVVRDDQGDPKVATQYTYVLFGVPVAQPIIVPEAEGQLGEVIARYAPSASCVRLYYGSDCNLTFTDGCTRFIEGRRLVNENRFCSRPYNNPRESGVSTPEVVLATYAFP